MGAETAPFMPRSMREVQHPPISPFSNISLYHLLQSRLYQEGEGVPRGDGHIVALIQGFTEKQTDMEIIGCWLDNIGYKVVNVGPKGPYMGSPQEIAMIQSTISDVASQEGEVYAVCHSLGGNTIIDIARKNSHVTKIAALGSPIAFTNIPPTCQVLSVTAVPDMVVGQLSFAKPPAINRAVFSDHNSLQYNQAAYRHVGNFLAA